MREWPKRSGVFNLNGGRGNLFKLDTIYFFVVSPSYKRGDAFFRFLEREINLYDYYRKFSFSDYTDEIHKRHDIERWVENIVNSAIDVGEIILSSEKKKIPNYYSDIFLQLAIMPQFKEIDSAQFTHWVKLRNILAHEYLDIKWKQIDNFIKENSEQLKLFLDSAKKFI